MRKFLLALVLITSIFITNSDATFTFNGHAGNAPNPVVNSSFENVIGSEWSCFDYFGGWSCTGGRTTEVVASDGAYTRKLPMTQDIDGNYGDAIKQNLTLPANKAITFRAKVRDVSASVAGYLEIVRTSTNSPLCNTSDTASNIDVWTDISCTVPSSNTFTDISVIIRPSTHVNGQSVYVDDVRVEYQDGTNTKLIMNLPTGSNGRRFTLIKPNGNIQSDVIVTADNSVTLDPVTVGTYVLRITDTNGTTFLDSSEFVAIDPTAGDETWTWTNTALAKDVTWDLILVGDTDGDGNCLNNGANGCYHKLQRNGVDYLFLGAALGNNLALNKTVVASSSASATCGQDGSACNAVDGDTNTRWYTNTAAPQWVCIDFGAATTFNMVNYITRVANYVAGSSETPYGGLSMAIQVSATDAGCNAGDFATISSVSRFSRELISTFSFIPQTKRYLRLLQSTVTVHSTAYEVEVYNEGISNDGSDIDYFIIRNENTGTQKVLSGIKYDSYTTANDGSRTFVKDIAGYGSINVHYKKFIDSWRKRFTITPYANSKIQIKNTLTKYTPSDTTCYYVKPRNIGNCTNCQEPRTNDTCSSYISTDGNNTSTVQYQAMALPYVFGIVADNGCRARYQDGATASSSDHFSVNGSLSGLVQTPIRTQVVSVYGIGNSTHDTVKDITFKVFTNKTTEFDSTIYRSVDPLVYEATSAGMIALADANSKTTLNFHEKLMWSSAYSRWITMANHSNCYQAYHLDYSKGGYQQESFFSLVGQNDPAKFKEMLWLWQRSTMNWSVANCTFGPGDPLSTNPLSLVKGGDCKDPFMMALYLGYAVSRGWVTIAQSCNASDMSCVPISVRDELATTIEAYIPTNGEYNESLGHLIFAPNLASNTNTDVTAFRQGMAMLAYRSLKAAGVQINETKYANAKGVFASLYDPTDGYVYAAKYGTWRTKLNSVASGGQYKYGLIDMYAPTTARFVVPAGITNGNMSFRYRAMSDLGYMTVKKNGTTVTGSPFDQYGSSWIYYNNSADVCTNLGGVCKADISSINPYGAPYNNINRVAVYDNNSTPTFSGAYSTVQVRVKSYTGGPTGVNLFYVDNGACSAFSWTCQQFFNDVIVADGTWQTVNLVITDPEWNAGDTIARLRTDFINHTQTGLLEIDWIKVTNGVDTITIEDFLNDSFIEQAITEPVSTGDVLLFQLDTTMSKNAGSSSNNLTLDSVIINGVSYEVESDIAFQCGDFNADCKNGFSLGWQRWKTTRGLVWDYLMRVFYKETALTDAQVKSHIEHLASSNLGNGTFYSYIATERDTAIPVSNASTELSYWGGNAGGNEASYWYYNASSWYMYDAMIWHYASTLLGDSPLWYKWDEKSTQFHRYGNWTSETATGLIEGREYESGANTYLHKYVWLSSTVNDYIEVSGIPYSDLEVYLVTGSSQGMVKIYFDNGTGYDAGTTIDLSISGDNKTATMTYTKTGLTYASTYKVKIQVISGAVRVDYVKVKVKPSNMLQFRNEAEYTIDKSSKSWIGTNYYSDSFRPYGDTGRYSIWSPIEIFYKGYPLSSPKRRFVFDGLFFRRMPK